VVRSRQLAQEVEARIDACKTVKTTPLTDRRAIFQSVERWSSGWMIRVIVFDSRRGLGIFPFTTASRTALVPTQPPMQWVLGLLPWGKVAGA
jgi:hypothetical protein